MSDLGTPWQITGHRGGGDTIDDCNGRQLFLVSEKATEHAKYAVKLVNGMTGLQSTLSRHCTSQSNAKDLADCESRWHSGDA